MSAPTQQPDAASVWLAEAAASEGRDVWLTPSLQRYIKVPQLPPPRYMLVRLMKQANGETVKGKIEWPAYVRLRRSLPRTLGLGCSPWVLIKLADAGFIKSCTISPGCIQIDLTSLHEHLLAASDPCFWTSERLAKYQLAMKTFRQARLLSEEDEDDEEDDEDLFEEREEE